MGEALGLMVWFTVTSESDSLETTADQLGAWIRDAGIDPRFVPGARSPVQAFRAATSGATASFVIDQQEIKLEVREVRSVDALVVRQVIATWREGKHATAERRVADLRFHRPKRDTRGRQFGTERVRVVVDKELDEQYAAHVQAFTAGLIAAFKRQRDLLQPAALRHVVRSHLLDLGAVAVEDTVGVYLVTPQQRPALEALAAVVGRCGPGCRIRMLPIADDPQGRTMIRELIESDIAARAVALTQTIIARMDDPEASVTSARWAGWRAEMEALGDWSLRYATSYDVTFPLAALALEELMETMAAVTRRVARQVRR